LGKKRTGSDWKLLNFAAIYPIRSKLICMTIDSFSREIADAVKSYDRHVVCLEKTPQEFQESLVSLMAKAIRAFETRAPGLRNGIALDKQVTIVLSDSGEEKPLCGIYFNLHSPYRKDCLPKTVKPLVEKSPKQEE
jgi:hypothetical protein